MIWFGYFYIANEFIYAHLKQGDKTFGGEFIWKIKLLLQRNMLRSDLELFVFVIVDTMSYKEWKKAGEREVKYVVAAKLPRSVVQPSTSAGPGPMKKWKRANQKQGGGKCAANWHTLLPVAQK